jgi:hypothetical protein
MFPIMFVGVKGALVLLSTYVVGFPIAKLYPRSRPWYEKAAADLKRTGSASFGGIVITSGGSSSEGGSAVDSPAGAAVPAAAGHRGAGNVAANHYAIRSIDPMGAAACNGWQ